MFEYSNVIKHIYCLVSYMNKYINGLNKTKLLICRAIRISKYTDI